MKDLFSAYETMMRSGAMRVAQAVDRLLAAPRQIRTETITIVLGAEAMPAPVPARRRDPLR